MSTPEQIVEAGYDAVAQTYLRFRHAHPGVAEIRRFADLLPPSGKVLDAGCGAGVPVAKYLAGRGFRVTGIDISKKMLDMARVNAPQADFRRMSLSRIRFSHGSFDGVACMHSILHIPRTRQAHVLTLFYDALKPQGLLLITVGMTDNPGEVEKDWFGTSMYFSHYDWQTSLNMIKSAGFRIVWTRRIGPKEDTHMLVLARKSERASPRLPNSLILHFGELSRR